MASPLLPLLPPIPPPHPLLLHFSPQPLLSAFVHVFLCLLFLSPSPDEGPLPKSALPPPDHDCWLVTNETSSLPLIALRIHPRA